MMDFSWAGASAQLTEILLAVLLAPVLVGWVNQCRAWLQNKSGPGILQPYRMLRKLFAKEAVLAHSASPLFRATPYACSPACASPRPSCRSSAPTCRSRPRPTRSRW